MQHPLPIDKFCVKHMRHYHECNCQDCLPVSVFSKTHVYIIMHLIHADFSILRCKPKMAMVNLRNPGRPN
jgi:hypothetical protein